MPYIGGNSVSVAAPSCMLADALTKVVLFAPPLTVEVLLEKHDAQAYLQRIEPDPGENSGMS
jgi:thiamine biosynthesis lipoprotein ApbE